MVSKILFLPFLQISSGHHQVADALAEHATRRHPDLTCIKTDILRRGFGVMESVVSRIYLNWIRWAPHTYHWLYARSVHTTSPKSFPLYVFLFRSVLKHLLLEEEPDLVVCTHALPSRILQTMKREGECKVPVVNAYTDYYVNALWGREEIDYHFVPDTRIRDQLAKEGVPASRLYVTGIPVHPAFAQNGNDHAVALKRWLPRVMVTGGHLGVGGLDAFVDRLPMTGKLVYYVFCGRNERLYHKLTVRNNPFCIPVPYVSCRRRMNDYYEQMDAVLTKPGGVTVSESLRKRRPVIVYGSLPGQETFNLRHLKSLGLVLDMSDWRTDLDESWECAVSDWLCSDAGIGSWRRTVDTYMSEVHDEQLSGWLEHVQA